MPYNFTPTGIKETRFAAITGNIKKPQAQEVKDDQLDVWQYLNRRWNRAENLVKAMPEHSSD